MRIIRDLEIRDEGRLVTMDREREALRLLWNEAHRVLAETRGGRWGERRLEQLEIVLKATDPELRPLLQPPGKLKHCTAAQRARAMGWKK